MEGWGPHHIYYIGLSAWGAGGLLTIQFKVEPIASGCHLKLQRRPDVNLLLPVSMHD